MKGVQTRGVSNDETLQCQCVCRGIASRAGKNPQQAPVSHLQQRQLETHSVAALAPLSFPAPSESRHTLFNTYMSNTLTPRLSRRLPFACLTCLTHPLPFILSGTSVEAAMYFRYHHNETVAECCAIHLSLDQSTEQETPPESLLLPWRLS